MSLICDLICDCCVGVVASGERCDKTEFSERIRKTVCWAGGVCVSPDCSCASECQKTKADKTS